MSQPPQGPPQGWDPNQPAWGPPPGWAPSTPVYVVVSPPKVSTARRLWRVAVYLIVTVTVLYLTWTVAPLLLPRIMG